MKIRELEQEIKTELEAAGLEDPGFETRQIIAGILNIASGELMLREHQELSEETIKKTRHWAAQRVRGIPLAYLTGKKGFYKYEFFVEQGVLVPRPESELVVETALARVNARKLKVLNLADLGCGSGILGLCLLLEFPQAELIAVDSSAVAAKVTLRNAEALGVEKRMQMVVSEVERYSPPHRFELVVANPPYIAEGDTNVQPSVHQHEPHEALYAADNGLAAIAKWSEWAHLTLVPGGIFVCEIGAGQSSQVKDIMSKLNFSEIQVAKDFAGHDRVVSAQR
ncbi:MAG: peptide chain release factor N(5)-glutamine methyltransferase [Bdellovibrionales bacterium]